MLPPCAPTATLDLALIFAAPGPRWLPPSSAAKNVDWSPAILMDGICAKQCHCSFRNGKTGNRTSLLLPPCEDEPDQPAAETWCSLCGPKFNKPIDIELHTCSSTKNPDPRIKSKYCLS